MAVAPHTDISWFTEGVVDARLRIPATFWNHEHLECGTQAA
jgi:hypothetical protein